MATISRKDRALLTKYFQMDGGYVLDFSNRTFANFFEEFEIDIEDEKYSLNYSSASKGNRMKGFWDLEDNQIVGNVLLGLIEYYDEQRANSYNGNQNHSDELREKCLKIGNELVSGTYNPDIKPGARLAQQHKITRQTKQFSQAELESIFALPTESVQPTQIPQFTQSVQVSQPSQTVSKPAQALNFDPPSKQRVFIVHGHDDVLRLEVENFIRKVGLEPIVLMDQASGGNTIIEKIERCGDADFAVVLYTPCDLGKHKNASELNGRARQNVVFEHGYFIARLGRQKVAAIVKQGVEIQNDIQGVVYIGAELDWRTSLLKEFHQAKLNFNPSGLYTS
ncbi:TIR domain-containing protein [Vibrio campbellii]|uniref:TIR domain-containing protein n=1 Tax=Vibrio campbellii TaxID=680 RepID=UPI0005EDDC14|nr:nucleotide-binding protein [Vibrio campbellii]